MSFISKKQDLFTNVNTQREVSGHGESVVGASYDSRYPTLKEIALKNKVSNKKGPLVLRLAPPDARGVPMVAFFLKPNFPLEF